MAAKANYCSCEVEQLDTDISADLEWHSWTFFAFSFEMIWGEIASAFVFAIVVTGSAAVFEKTKED